MNIPVNAMYQGGSEDNPEGLFFLIYLFDATSEEFPDELYPVGYVADKDGKQISFVGYLGDFMAQQSDDSWTETGNKIDRTIPSELESYKIVDDCNAKFVRQQ